MRPQHLSDEAVAAFADGVLTGAARERARAHTAQCPECAHSVAVQREAVWALRAAPAPSLPSGLVDRLRDVPVTTPISVPPTVVGPDGSTLLATFAGMQTAALVPEQPARRPHRALPIVGTAAAVAVAGVLAVSSAAHASGSGQPAPEHRPNAPANVQPAVYAPLPHPDR